MTVDSLGRGHLGSARAGGGLGGSRFRMFCRPGEALGKVRVGRAFIGFACAGVSLAHSPDRVYRAAGRLSMRDNLPVATHIELACAGGEFDVCCDRAPVERDQLS